MRLKYSSTTNLNTTIKKYDIQMHYTEISIFRSGIDKKKKSQNKKYTPRKLGRAVRKKEMLNEGKTTT